MSAAVPPPAASPAPGIASASGLDEDLELPARLLLADVLGEQRGA